MWTSHSHRSVLCALPVSPQSSCDPATPLGQALRLSTYLWHTTASSAIASWTAINHVHTYKKSKECMENHRDSCRNRRNALKTIRKRTEIAAVTLMFTLPLRQEAPHASSRDDIQRGDPSRTGLHPPIARFQHFVYESSRFFTFFMST